MTDEATAERPRRITAAERELMQHEERMAALTKRVSASETMSVKQGGTGTLAGKWYCDGMLIVREEGEDWSQWLGRLDKMMGDVQSVVTQRNLAMFEEQTKEIGKRNAAKAKPDPVTGEVPF